MKYLNYPFFTESSAIFDIQDANGEYFGEVHIHFNRRNVLQLSINFHAVNKSALDALDDFSNFLYELNYDLFPQNLGLLTTSQPQEIWLRVYYFHIHEKFMPVASGSDFSNLLNEMTDGIRSTLTSDSDIASGE